VLKFHTLGVFSFPFFTFFTFLFFIILEFFAKIIITVIHHLCGFFLKNLPLIFSTIEKNELINFNIF